MLARKGQVPIKPIRGWKLPLTIDIMLVTMLAMEVEVRSSWRLLVADIHSYLATEREQLCIVVMEAYNGLTPDFFQNLIAISDPGVVINTIEVSTGAGRGDNYTSMLYRVRAEGVTPSEDVWKKSFICKILPINRERREAFKSESLFRNEVAFYTRALPALLAFQSSKGYSIFQETPKVYLAESHILVLEDLKERGFTMPDRKKALDVAHCQAILKTLGHLHGVSLALKTTEPGNFALQVTGQVSECLFKEENEEWYTEYYRRAGRNASRMLRERLDEVVNFKKYSERFDKFMSPGFFRRMINAIRPVEPIAVLCHGDCWTNNFLFRYRDDGTIADLCMVDFQFARYGSPALDLVYLFFNCTTRELRSQHFSSLLGYYVKAVEETLATFGCPLDVLGEGKILDIIEQEVKRCSGIGLGLAVEMIPICTCDSEQAPDLYSGQQNIEEQEKAENAESLVSSNDICRSMLTDLIMELVEADVI